MIRNLTAIEIKMGDRGYQFICSPDSPLAEIHEVLSMMRGMVLDKINEATKESPKVEE